MSIATIVVSLVLTVLVATASAPHLLGSASATKYAEHLGVPAGLYLFVVGVCEAVVVVGLIVGLYWLAGQWK